MNGNIMGAHLIVYLIALMACLNILSWNMRTLRYAEPYLYSHMGSHNIIFACEHRLYASELHKLDKVFSGFHGTAKASSDLQEDGFNNKPGHCGVAMAWKDDLNQCVKVINGINSDRICGIKLIGMGKNKCNVYVIGVYLPHQQCKINDFESEVETLEVLINQCAADGEVVIVGDYNCHFGEEHGIRFGGQTTKDAKTLGKMIDRCSLNIIDKDSRCSGPNYTFYVEGIGMSYIDHVLATPVCSEVIKNCSIIPDSCDNSSDHLAVSLSIEIDTMANKKSNNSLHKIAWHKMTKEEIEKKYTGQITKSLENQFSDILSSPDGYMKCSATS